MCDDGMTITGQVRLRRKLVKSLFFVDIQPTDETSKSQVFFRTDDNSLDIVNFQENFRACRPGNVVRLSVVPPWDPQEQEGKLYKVWQCCTLVEVVQPYTSREAFLQDRPLGSTMTEEAPPKKPKINKPCKYWINKNKCERGEECVFQHPTGDAFEVARTNWLREREEQRKEATHDPDDPHTSKKPHGLRAIIFADWIRRTFVEQLKNGNTVLDVAGGKGEISMVLSRGFGIPSTVVEPKKRKLPNYWYTRLRRLMYRFQTDSLDQPDWKSKDIQVDLQHWPHDDVEPKYLHTMLDDQFLIDHADLLQNVSLFIGLHSDQATVPIVEAALKARKAFAVVPCCVFSHDNRSRQLRDGKLVVTTEDQIQYLCEKDDSIKTDYLDFEGKNRVVYWIPKDE